MPTDRDSKPLTPACHRQFRAFTLAIPVLFFMLLEAALRLGGYDKSHL